MKYKIHFVHNNVEDCVIVSGRTIEEIRDLAIAEMRKRFPQHGIPDDCWSEEVQ